MDDDRPPLFYEDFHAGQVFTSEPRTMERDAIIAFARDFDPQPQHLSEESAATSLFGTLVASGWHTASVTMRMQLEAVFARVPGGAMGAQIDTLAWRRPVHPGDQLSAVTEVRDLRLTRRGDRGLLTLHTTTRNQHGQDVMEQTASVLVPCRAA